MDEIEELKKKVYYIYGHRNKINGKWYIGQTCQNPERRWRYNGKGYLSYGKNVGSNKFANAIKKYGWENFEHVILETTNEENVDKLETYYIQKYNSVENGYNLTYGGANHKISEETRQKMSNNRKGEKNPFYGKHHTQEDRQRMSDFQKFRQNLPEVKYNMSIVHKGKKLSEEHKLKISNSTKGINSKKVLCIETNTIYDSITIAGKSVGIKMGSHIYDCCVGKRNTCGGYHWKYYDEKLLQC